MVGLGIADAAHDRQLLVVHSLCHALERRVEPELRRRGAAHRRGVGQFGACVVIGIVGVRDQGVDTVVAAVEGDDDEDAAAVGKRTVAGGPLSSGHADGGRTRQQASAPTPTLASRNLRRLISGIANLATTSGIREC